MILSNVELQAALDAGRLIINPEPFPRRPEPGRDCPYGTHSVDLTLGDEITILEPGQFSFDLARPGKLAEFIDRNSRRITITPAQPFLLERHKFVLGMTRARVALPILDGFDTCLAARIEGKSSRARCASLVHFTAPTVHPGFDGTLTLEMINLGEVDFILRPGMAIAQLIVEEVKGIPFRKPSQFQGQNTPAGERK
jgi:dCTP deaminase